MPFAMMPAAACALFVKEPIVEFANEVYGIYFRSVFLKEEGTSIDQHVHDHDHCTFVGSGEVRLWVNGDFVGDFEAGLVIPVEKGKKHSFKSLKPDTRLTCVHIAASAESAKRK